MQVHSTLDRSTSKKSFGRKKSGVKPKVEVLESKIYELEDTITYLTTQHKKEVIQIEAEYEVQVDEANNKTRDLEDGLNQEIDILQSKISNFDL